MNSALSGKFQAYTISEELIIEHDNIRAMESEGHRFIALMLNEKIMDEQEQRFGNVYKLRVFRDRQIRSGQTNISDNIEQGHLVFRYDPHLRRHAAYLWDDDRPGEFSERGYNRDFLASHYEHRAWEIEDKDIEDDIKERLAYLKSTKVNQIQQTNTDQPLTDQEMQSMSLKGLEEQIELLTKAKEQVILRQDGQAPTPNANILGADGQPIEKVKAATIPPRPENTRSKTTKKGVKKSVLPKQSAGTRQPVSALADIK